MAAAHPEVGHLSDVAAPLPGMDCAWLAVQVWSGREALAARYLRQRGYHIFLPCYGERRRWSDRIKVVEHALFPGYLFCRGYSHSAPKIVTSPNVIRVVGDGSGPRPIPEAEIEAIQRVVATRLEARPWAGVQVGERVRVERGPLSGVEGVVMTFRNRNRLLVSVSLLQRAVAIEIDADWIDLPRAVHGAQA